VEAATAKPKRAVVKYMMARTRVLGGGLSARKCKRVFSGDGGKVVELVCVLMNSDRGA